MRENQAQEEAEIKLKLGVSNSIRCTEASALQAMIPYVKICFISSQS